MPDSGVIVFAISIIAGAGAAAWRLGSLEARVKELERSRLKTGERLGRLEEVARHVRRLTAPAGTPAVDDTGKVLAPVDDESSNE